VDFYESVAILIVQAGAVGVTFLLIRAYFAALGFEVVKLERFARLAIVPLLIFMVTHNFFIMNFLTVAIVIIVSKLAICYAVARGNRLLILVAGLFYILLSLIFEMASMTVAALLGFDVTIPIFTVILTHSFIFVFFALLIAIIRKINIGKSSYSAAKFGDVVPVILMIVGCGILVIYIYDSFHDLAVPRAVQGRFTHFSLIFALLLIFPAGVTLYYSAIRQAKAKQQNAAYQQQLQFYGDYFHERELDYQRGKVLEHDQKQQFNYLLNAMENDQIEDGIAYLKQQMQDVFLSRLEMTDNLAINSVLNHKHQVISESQIKMRSLIEVPKHVHINDVDLCIIFGNLLDNAIEAVNHLPLEKKIITVRIRYDGEKDGGGNLFIRIKNPHLNVLSKGGLGGFLTSKHNQDKHGLGLYSVKRTLEKYDGTLDIVSDEKEFVATALIYGEKSEDVS